MLLNSELGNNDVCLPFHLGATANGNLSQNESQKDVDVPKPKQTAMGLERIGEATKSKEHYYDLLDDESLDSPRQKQPVKTWLEGWQADFSKAVDQKKQPGCKTQI